jgi:hypothetical protein
VIYCYCKSGNTHRFFLDVVIESERAESSGLVITPARSEPGYCVRAVSWKSTARQPPGVTMLRQIGFTGNSKTAA